MRHRTQKASLPKLVMALIFTVTGVAAIIAGVIVDWPTGLIVAGLGSVYVGSRIDVDRPEETPEPRAVEGSREAL